MPRQGGASGNHRALGCAPIEIRGCGIARVRGHRIAGDIFDGKYTGRAGPVTGPAKDWAGGAYTPRVSDPMRRTPIGAAPAAAGSLCSTHKSKASAALDLDTTVRWPIYVNVINIHAWSGSSGAPHHKREAVMPIVAKLDELGRPAWIALMILGFIAWWPLGLATLAYIIGSGRMSCWSYHGMDRWQYKMERLQQKMERMRARAGFDGRDPGRIIGAISARAATAPSTTIAPRRCAASRTSNASSAISSTACAMPRTRPNSTSSWQNGATGRRSPARNRIRRFSPGLPAGRAKGK